MTAHLPRKFDALLRCSGKARGHRPRLQLRPFVGFRDHSNFPKTVWSIRWDQEFWIYGLWCKNAPRDSR